MKKTVLLLAACGFLLSVTAQNIAVGKNGAVVTTTNGGNTWVDKRPTTGQLIDVVGISKYSTNNWVISQFKTGSGNYIQRTTDGGDNYIAIATNLNGSTNYQQEMAHFGPDTLLLLSRLLTNNAIGSHSSSSLTTSATVANGGNERAPHFGLTKINSTSALVINNSTSGMPFSSNSEIYKYATKTATAGTNCFNATTGIYEHNQISGAVRVDATTLFAVGNKNGSSDGALYKTTDNGATWSTVSLPTVPSGCALLDIAISPNKQTIIVVGSKNYVVRSADAGENWTRITPTALPGTATNWTYNIARFADNDTILVGGNDGSTGAGSDSYALRSTNGGASFTAIPTLTSDNYTDLTGQSTNRLAKYHSIYFANSSIGYIVLGRADGDKKYEMLKTNDGGATWTHLTWEAGKKPNVRSFEIVNHLSTENELIVNSLSTKNVWKIDVTATEIAATSIVSVYTAKDLRNIYKKSATELYALESTTLATEGGIYKSTDGGLTWSLATAEANGQPMICITDGFVGGFLGRAYTANADFSTLTRTSILGHLGGNLKDLSSTYKNSPNTSSATIFAIGESGGIFKSTNAGATFTYIGKPEWADYTYTAVNAVDENTVYVCGFNAANKGIIIKTTNSGTDWTKVEFSSVGKLNDIEMYNATQGLAVGDGGVILGTVDGENWISKSPAGLTDDLLKVVCDEPVTLTGDPEITTGINEVAKLTQVYVSNNKLNIVAGKGTKVMVINLLGVVEYSATMHEDKAVIELPTGIKIVKTDLEGSTLTTKVILR